MNENRIIFIGTSHFAAEILKKMIAAGWVPFLIITAPDRPAGRGKKTKESPVSVVAKEKKISLLKPDKIFNVADEIAKKEPKLLVLCAYGQKVPQKILDIPEKGALNVHPSLLPEYRGPSPISQAILDNREETGVTIMLMDEKIDRGPILSQKRHPIKEEINFLQLSEELSKIGGELLIETISRWEEGKIVPQKQKEIGATYTELLKKEDGRIDWKESAGKIERKVRALNPWPGTFSYYLDKKSNQKKILKILEAETQKQDRNGPFGPCGKVYMATNNNLAVQAGKDFLIIKKLQVENKNPAKAEEFLNGNIDFIGIILE